MRKNNLLKRIAVMSLAVIMGIQTMPISAYADETIDVIGETSEDNNEVFIPSTSDNDPGISLLSLSFGNNNWGTTCPDGTHKWNNAGTCTVCGTVCSHTNTNSVANDENTHKIVCNDCGLLVSEDAHQKNGVGVCMVCGYCPHTNTYGLKSYYPDQPNHKQTCSTCGEVILDEPHTYVDNICSVCGYMKPVEMTMIDSVPSQITGSYKMYSSYFSHRVSITHKGGKDSFDCDDLGNPFEICGYDGTFDLDTIVFYSITEDGDAVYLGHIKMDDYDTSIPINDMTNSNLPSIGPLKYIYMDKESYIRFSCPAGEKIGYTLLGTCNHTNTKAVSIDENTHKTLCSDCGILISEDAHNYENNVCVDCGQVMPATITVSQNILDHADVYYSYDSNSLGKNKLDSNTFTMNRNERLIICLVPKNGYAVKDLFDTTGNVVFAHDTSVATIGISGTGNTGSNYVQSAFVSTTNVSENINIDGTFYDQTFYAGHGFRVSVDKDITESYYSGVAGKGTISIDKSEGIEIGNEITLTITPNENAKAKTILFKRADTRGKGYESESGNTDIFSGSLEYYSTNLDQNGYMTMTECSVDENGIWTVKFTLGREAELNNFNNRPIGADIAVNVLYEESTDLLIKPNTNGTAVIESKDMDNGTASIKVTADDGYFYTGYRYAYADTIDDVTEADWITGQIYKAMVPENPYTENIWFDTTQGKNYIFQPIFERNYATTVPYLTVMGLSKNIKVSDPVQIPGAPSGYVNWTNDCFASTADNSVAKKSNFYKLFGNTYNVSLYYADVDNCYGLSTSGTSYCANTQNHLTKPGDTIYVLSKYKQDDFKGYGILNSGNTLTINIPSLRTLDNVVTDGKVTDTEITPVQEPKAKYFVGKYTIPDSWPASDNREDRFSCVYPEYRAINYKINTKNVDHGTYTAKNDTPERYNWVSTGYVNEHGVFGKNPIYHNGNAGFVASSDVLPDNLFTYMDTVKCVATPNTGWHVKAWVCMQDGVNIWDGMFDDETADYSTFSINMTNLGDAEIYPVFEGVDPVKPVETPTIKPTETPKPTVEPTKEPTPTETPAKTPEPEQEKDEDPEPTPKPAVIPVTPTKPDDPEPTETPEPTKAPEKPVKSAEPEVVITPPAVEPVELEDNITKVVPAVLSVTGTGVGGLAILILLKRRKRKFHGIFADAEIPGTKEKYGNTVLNILDLMTKVNDKEINVAEYEDMLNNSDTYTYFPADTKITLITEDAEYSFDANEKKLFTELLNVKGDVSIIFKSEEKNIELQYEMTL